MKTFILSIPMKVLGGIDRQNQQFDKAQRFIGRSGRPCIANRINPTNPLPYIKPSAQRTFAADHGIVEEGKLKSPKEITWQQLSNFLHGGAELILCRQHGFKLVLVDSGVDYDLPYGERHYQL